jgi:hypothetical protein
MTAITPKVSDLFDPALAGRRPVASIPTRRRIPGDGKSRTLRDNHALAAGYEDCLAPAHPVGLIPSNSKEK